MTDITARAALQAQHPNHHRLVKQAEEMVAAHLDDNNGHIAWSGGKDSTVLAHLANRVRPGTPIVTYVAGTEYPEVLPYCNRLAEEYGWVWDQIQTADVLDVLREIGRRPTSSDTEYWDAMIAGPAAVAHEKYGAGLLWGLRMAESRSRRVQLAASKGVYHRSDGVVTCAPLWRWDDLDIWGYLFANNVPVCPTYERMAEIGIPERDRRVGRMIGRRMSRSWVDGLRRGWPTEWSRLTNELPWLLDLG